MNLKSLLLPLTAGMLLASCAGENPAALAAQDRADCTALGFTGDSDSFKLCLMLQQQNRRLTYIEGRLGFLEMDVNRIDDLGIYDHRHR
ncbi:MAG: hypothetical protein H6851_11395 [Geminicoccaceae bacterium]|nr:hypothetical protein [Geminicoccaceae bacterium]MCB9944207.1 hypothetical protein [Geminicoccaceae bacterium]